MGGPTGLVNILGIGGVGVADGDIWANSGGVFARINGVSQAISATAVFSYAILDLAAPGIGADQYLFSSRKPPSNVAASTNESIDNAYITPISGHLGTVRLSSFSTAVTLTFKIYKNFVLAATVPGWAVAASLVFNTYDASAIAVTAGDRISISVA